MPNWLKKEQLIEDMITPLIKIMKGNDSNYINDRVKYHGFDFGSSVKEPVDIINELKQLEDLEKLYKIIAIEGKRSGCDTEKEMKFYDYIINHINPNNTICKNMECKKKIISFQDQSYNYCPWCGKGLNDLQESPIDFISLTDSKLNQITENLLLENKWDNKKIEISIDSKNSSIVFLEKNTTNKIEYDLEKIAKEEIFKVLKNVPGYYWDAKEYYEFDNILGFSTKIDDTKIEIEFKKIDSTDSVKCSYTWKADKKDKYEDTLTQLGIKDAVKYLIDNCDEIEKAPNLKKDIVCQVVEMWYEGDRYYISDGNKTAVFRENDKVVFELISKHGNMEKTKKICKKSGGLLHIPCYVIRRSDLVYELLRNSQVK